MTMDEIEKLATKLEHHAQADVRTGRSPEDRHPARIAARAALLRAVEGIVRERDRAESALAAARALVESEQAWGLQYGDARCIWCGASPADPVEFHGDGCEFGALIRALASPPPAATRLGARLAEALHVVTHDHPDGYSCSVCTAELKQVRAALAPPPAALSTETEAAPAENVRAACGHITADRGAHPLRCDVCAPTPTKSKEDSTP